MTGKGKKGDEADIIRRRDALHDALLDAEAAQYDWQKLLAEGNRLPVLLEQYEAEVETDLEQLVDAKGDDVKRLQADIRARRSLARSIRAMANGEAVAAARQRLEEFEAANALFLQAREG